MKMIRSFLVVCMLFFGINRYSEEEDSVSTVILPPELDRVLRDYESAWNMADAHTLSELFSVDGFLLSGGTPAI